MYVSLFGRAVWIKKCMPQALAKQLLLLLPFTHPLISFPFFIMHYPREDHSCNRISKWLQFLLILFVGRQAGRQAGSQAPAITMVALFCWSSFINAFPSFLHLEQEKSKNKAVNKLTAAKVIEQNVKRTTNFLLVILTAFSYCHPQSIFITYSLTTLIIVCSHLWRWELN